MDTRKNTKEKIIIPGNPQIEFQNGLIIIGANGSGKTRLGVEIESHATNNAMRIAAHKSLSFPARINALDTTDQNKEKPRRYGNSMQRMSQKNHYATELCTNFDKIVNNLYSLNSQFCTQLVYTLRQENRAPNSKEITLMEKVVKIWNKVITHREMINKDSFPHLMPIGNHQSAYKMNDASDGERVIFYLIVQCLTISGGVKKVVVDEPEAHIHPSIRNLLWQEIENYCPNIKFIYITHDLDFAASKNNFDKIWVKSVSAPHQPQIKWDFHIIQNQDMPENMYLKILGSRKKIIFVEGQTDCRFFKNIFDDCLVINAEGCEQVSKYVESLNKNTNTHHCKAIGIIDKDYQEEETIINKKAKDIYSLSVLELENLFFTDDFLQIMVDSGALRQENVESSKNNICVKFKTQEEKDRQVKLYLQAYVKNKLHGIDLKKIALNETEIIDAVKDYIGDLSNIKKRKENEHEAISDYEDIISIFNCKGMLNLFNPGLGKDEYIEMIIEKSGKEQHKERMKQIVSKYLSLPDNWD